MKNIKLNDCINYVILGVIYLGYMTKGKLSWAPLGRNDCVRPKMVISIFYSLRFHEITE